ncbi:hypothetical protein [Aestuariivirga sp.]|uniref:bestrophin-like domain n=1 Tax=Aestuariivirga sp. TaxID=2650926 RepID=UPI0039E4EB71
MTGLVAAVIYQILKTAVAGRLLAHVSDLSPILQTLCGTLFVLSVTFLANSVWATENQAGEAVHAEARTLRVIRTYMDSMTGPAHDTFLKLTQDYASASAAEWDTMAEHGGSPQAEAALSGIYRAVLLGFSAGEDNRLLQQRMLVELDELSSARAQRLTMAQDVVSGGQWFTVISLALLFLSVIGICHGRWPASRALALSVITLAISISLFVIVVHDRPFYGQQQVTPHPVLEAAGLAG